MLINFDVVLSYRTCKLMTSGDEKKVAVHSRGPSVLCVLRYINLKCVMVVK